MGYPYAHCVDCEAALEPPTTTDYIVGVQNCPHCGEVFERITEFERRAAIEDLLKTVDDLNRKQKNSHLVRTPVWKQSDE